MTSSHIYLIVGAFGLLLGTTTLGLDGKKESEPNPKETAAEGGVWNFFHNWFGYGPTNNESKSQEPVIVNKPNIPKDKTSDKPTKLTAVSCDLTTSYIDNGQMIILSAFEDVAERFEKDKSKPIVFYIATLKSKELWPSLINMAIDKELLSSQDVMWVVDEYVQRKWLGIKDVEDLLAFQITSQKTRRLAYIISLLWTISIKQPDGFIYKNTALETYSPLVQIIENSRENSKYLDAFRKIVEILPVDLPLESVLGASRFENGKVVEYRLVAWLMREQGRYLDKNRIGYTHYIAVAQHILNRKLSLAVPQDTRDLNGALIEMLSLLCAQNDISVKQYAVASLRFEIPKTE